MLFIDLNLQKCKTFPNPATKILPFFQKYLLLCRNNLKKHTPMKKLIFIFASLLMLISLSMHAQNNRVLLFECFTNTGCGPCAQQNPGLDALISANSDNIAAIKYHMSWPSDSDPMYLHNTADNNSRKGVYSINAVPHTVVDGIRFSNQPVYLNQSMVNQYLSIESPYEMRLSYDVDETAGTITMYVMGRASQAITGNLKLYVGVIEKEIHFNSAPGPNGERDFYSVMKKLLPSASGTVIGSVEAGDYFTYSFSWEYANVYNVDQLDAIAWIQNTNTKEVIQACKSSTTMQPFFANEAMVSGISNVKKTNCSGEAQPLVVLSNYGSNPLTTAVLEVLVNDELLKTITWTGNLATTESTIVDLGDIAFTVEDDNVLEVRVQSVNGVDDEAPDNDVTTFTIKGAPENVNTTLKLSIRTDSNPQETTWKVTDLATGEVVLEGGPYDQANHAYNETLTIETDGCYDFTIYDAGGDGLAGSGLYGLKSNGTTLFSGKDFGYSESHEFSYTITVGAEENNAIVTHVYPNPTTGMVSIVSEGEWTVTIYNMAGQRVYEGLGKGYLQIDMSAFDAGIYAVKVGNETQRIIVR